MSKYRPPHRWSDFILAGPKTERRYRAENRSYDRAWHAERARHDYRSK